MTKRHFRQWLQIHVYDFKLSLVNNYKDVAHVYPFDLIRAYLSVIRSFVLTNIMSRCRDIIIIASGISNEGVGEI